MRSWMCFAGQTDGQPTQAGVEVDSDGYKTEQRTETEQCSQTEDVRELEGGHATETRRRQVKEVRLEEVKSRESGPRPATAEEIRALLGAEFSSEGGGAAEIQTSHEITVEEFTRVERKHARIDGGTGETQTETTTTEGRRTELISEQPQWKIKAEKSLGEPGGDAETKAEATGQLVSLPIVSADVDVSLPQPAVEVATESPKPSMSKGGGIFAKFMPKLKGERAEKIGERPDTEGAAGGAVPGDKADVTVEVGAETIEPSTEWASEHHKVKHKRHVIEEVVLEDSDKFYEEIHKRPRLFLRAKKKPADKENVEPVVERRRSTGELPEAKVEVQQTGSAANVSSEELVKFVVQYDLASPVLDENVPKGKKRWTMPTFGRGDETADVSAEPTAEKKRKTGDKQDEVVVEDEDLFTDTSLKRKGFPFQKKKADQSVEPQSETVTFIVHGDQPGAYVKVEPRVEVDEDGDQNIEAKTGLHGSLEFPKFKLFERKQKTSSSEDGETSSLKSDSKKWIPHIRLRSKYAKFGKLSAKGDTVTYHSTDGSLPTDVSQQNMKWPQLNVHFGGKYVTPDTSTDELKADTETYVIEHIEQVPRELAPDEMDTSARFPKLRFALNNKSASESPEDAYVIYRVDHRIESSVSADDKSKDRMQWPDLKLMLTSPLPSPTKGEDQKFDVTPTYVVNQILPVSSVTADTGSPQEAKSPNVHLHFVAIGDGSEEQKITYIVEHPDRPASFVEGQGGSSFEMPKFKQPHFGTWPGKHGGAALPEFSALLMSVDELPRDEHREDDHPVGGVLWPKLNFNFDCKPTKDGSHGSQTIADMQTVPYVPEQHLPSDEKIQWPAVGLDYGTKTATLIDIKDYSGKTVTYSPEKAGSVKTSSDVEAEPAQRLQWPKFKVHFNARTSQRHSEDSGLVSYIFEQPAQISVPTVDKREGMHIPKFGGLHIGSKLSRPKAGDLSQEPETVTYIVEEPTPETTDKGLQIVWPKVDFRLRRRKKADESELDVEPEVVTYVIEQPAHAESDVVDGKMRFRLEWPKFDKRFGGTKKTLEDIPAETKVTYVVQEIAPEPSGDESKPELQWPKLRIRFGAKSDDEHPDTAGIDETVTYVVEQPSPDIGQRKGTGFHLPGLHTAGKPAAEEQRVTYVVDSPSTTDSSTERQRHFRVKLPKLSVKLGLKKVKHGEGNGDARGEIVTYVVEQIVPIDGDKDRVRSGIDWPKFPWQFKTKHKDNVSDSIGEETVTYIVEAPDGTSATGTLTAKPKFDLRFRKKAKKDEDEMDTESDNAPFVLEKEMHVKTKVQLEWPKFKSPHFKGKPVVEGEDGDAYAIEEVAPMPSEDSSATSGGIRLPKLSVKFRGKTPDPAGERKTNTVNYVVEKPSDVHDSSEELRWSQLNLHFHGKADKKTAETPEIVTYVADTSGEQMTDIVEEKQKAGISWPKLKVHFELKSTELDTEDVDGPCEKVTYTVKQIVPVPDAEPETVTYIVEAQPTPEEGRPGFAISVPKPKIDLRFRKKTKKPEYEVDMESETPYTLEQELPGESAEGRAKTRLHIEWPKFKFPHLKRKDAKGAEDGTAYVVEEISPVTPEDSDNGSSTGGIRWPKLNVRFGSKSPEAQAEEETNTVTYVVEKPPPAEIGESGGLHWPKFDVHLRGKADEKAVGTPETVTYVVEQPTKPLTDDVDVKGKAGLNWPKLKVHFGLKSAEPDVGDVEGKGGKVTYAVEHIVPLPREGEDKKKAGGIEWPSLPWHFRKKASDKLATDGETDMETVTYIVETPTPSEEGKTGISLPKPKIDYRFRKKTRKPEEEIDDTESDTAPYVLEQPMPDESGSADVKTILRTEWPTFKCPRFKGKPTGRTESGATSVVEEIYPVPPDESDNGSTTGGILWPKLNVRFGSKTPGNQADAESKTVTYVVEKPSPEEPSYSGVFQWPKFDVHLREKAGEKTSGKAETVTYVIEQPTEPLAHDAEGTGKVGLHWPKLKLNFGLKSTEPDAADTEGKVEKVTYAVEDIVPIPREGDDKKIFGGIEWPSLPWRFGKKVPEKSATDADADIETVTYIVEAPRSTEEGTEAHGVSLPKPKIDFRFRKKTKKPDVEIDTDSESTPLVLEQPLPDESGSGDVKTTLRTEWPKFKFPGRKGKHTLGKDRRAAAVVEEISPVPPEDGDDGCNIGGIRWPKLNVRFGSKTPEAQAEGEPATVTYVVEKPPPAVVGESGGLHWPKFDVHLRGKADEKTAGTTEAVTYVVDQPTEPLADDAEVKGTAGLTWPKLKVHFGLKSTEPDSVDIDGKVEKVTYVVEQIIPIPIEGEDKKIAGGIEWPSLPWPFRKKVSDKVATDSEADTETVTYIVETPTVSEEGKDTSGILLPKPKIDLHIKKKTKKPEEEIDAESDSTPYVLEQPLPDESGSGDVKRKLHIEWPKFKLPRFKGKFASATDSGDAAVVEEIAPVPPEAGDDGSATGGIRWPKLNVRFGSKTPEAQAEGETNTVTYVVEQPSAEAKELGRIHWPKFDLHLRGKAGGKIAGTPETVTYVVEQPSEPLADDTEGKGKVGLHWPKLKIHFGPKSAEHDTPDVDGSERVSYVVEQIEPVAPEAGNKKIIGGIEWPKLRWPRKMLDEDDAEGEKEMETVTYVVEVPAPVQEGKGGFGISVPKPQFRKKLKKPDGEVEQETETAPYVVEQPMPHGRDAKTKLHIEWPKFKFPHFKGKAEAGGEGGDSYIVEEVTPVPAEESHNISTTGGIRWPKLSVRLRTKPQDAQTEDEFNTVTYVVEGPPADQNKPHELHWPKFDLHLRRKAGEKTPDALETVTYIAEEPRKPLTDDVERKGKLGIAWPKLKVQLGLKSTEPQTTDVDGEGSKVSYVVDQITQISPVAGGSPKRPKVRWSLNVKTSGKGEPKLPKESETVTYVVETPSPSEEGEKRGFGISVPKPKLDIRFKKRTKEPDDQVEAEPGTAPYVIEQRLSDDSGSGDVKRKIRIEWPKFKFPRLKGKTPAEPDGGAGYVVEEIAPVPAEDINDSSATGGIRWPMLNVRFGSRTPEAQAEPETSSVTYVVEQPATEVVESGGLHWPKFDLHLRGKAGEKPADTTETVTYVVQQPAEPVTDDTEGKGKLGLSWPKLKVHFKPKPVEPETVEGKEEVVYTVNQIVPVPESADEKKTGGGIEWPKFRLHLPKKKADKISEHEEEPETVTYIVEAPDPSQEVKGGFGMSLPKPKIGLQFRKKTKEPKGADKGFDSAPFALEQPMPGTSGPGDVKTTLRTEWPKFKFPRSRGKGRTDNGAAAVVEEISPVSPEVSDNGSTTGGIRWPKLNVRFGSKTPEAQAEGEPATVTYVVEKPSPGELAGFGGFHWPKFDRHLSAKAGEKAAGTAETVTYVVEQPTEPVIDDAEVKGKAGLTWPKLKVHFGLRSEEPDAEDVDGKGKKVTYAVEQIVPVPREGQEKKTGGGFSLPKLRFRMPGKTSGSYVVNDVQDTETVTYVVEDRDTSQEGAANAGLSIPKVPKFDFKFGRKKKAQFCVDAEQAPYFVEQPMPDGDSEKTQLRMEWPKFRGDADVRDAANGDTHVLKEITPLAVEDGDDGSATGGVRWPKLCARYGTTKPQDEDTNVTYVVKSPSSPSGSVDTDRNFWPRFNLYKAGEAGVRDSSSTPDQSVTYAVPADSASHSLGLPNLQVHLGLKSVEPQDPNDADAGEKITYAADSIAPEPAVYKGDASLGIEWPKVKLPRVKKTAEPHRTEAAEPERVTYVIEPPSAGHEDERKGFGISFPKIFGVKGGRADLEKEESPKDTDAGADTDKSKGGSWFGGSFSLGKLSLTKKGDLPEVDKKVVERTADVDVSESIPRVGAAADSSFDVEVGGRAPEVGGMITSTPKRTVAVGDVSGSSVHAEASSSFRLSGATDLFGGGGVDIDVQIQPMVFASTAAAPTMSSPGSSATVDDSTPSPPGAVPSRGAIASRGSPPTLWQTPHFVIVAIDFGTSFSGYAFCFPRDVAAATSAGEPLPTIHVMRKWEGGDPGAVDMKTPTTLLLTPDAEFHSFGFTARDFYHDLSPAEARRWLYFDKFKMALHYNTVRCIFSLSSSSSSSSLT